MKKLSSIFTRVSKDATRPFEYSTEYLPVICQNGKIQSHFLTALKENKNELGDDITAIYFGHLGALIKLSIGDEFNFCVSI